MSSINSTNLSEKSKKIVSSNLGTGKILGLVETLGETARDLAGRAGRLHDDFQTRSERERQRLQAGLTESAARTSAAITQTETEFEERRAGLEEHFSARQRRVGKAYQSSKEQRLGEVEERLGAAKYEWQKQSLGAERARAATTVANHARFEEFKRGFGEEQQRLADLELRVGKAFKGYSRFQKLLMEPPPGPSAAAEGDELQSLAAFTASLDEAGKRLQAFRHLWLTRWSRYFVVWIVLTLGVFALPELLRRGGAGSLTYVQAGALFGGVLTVIIALRVLAQSSAAGRARSLSEALHHAKRLENQSYQLASARHDEEAARITRVAEETLIGADQELKRANAKASEDRVAVRMRADERTVRINQRLETMRAASKGRVERSFQDKLKLLGATGVERAEEIRKTSDHALQKLQREQESAWTALKSEWEAQANPLYEAILTARQTAARLFPPWQAEFVEAWSPPSAFARVGKYSRGTRPRGFGWPASWGPRRGGRRLPACSLECPDEGSVLIETDGSGQPAAVGTLNNLILRLLSVAPPGRLAFTILDPVGLGQNFAGVMADYDDNIINSRILTQPSQIEQRLADLNEHMEKVIQMYLRNEYATIAEYNEQAGNIAEKLPLSWSSPISPPASPRRPPGGSCTSRPAAPAAASSRSSTGTTATPRPRISFPRNCARAAWSCTERASSSSSRQRLGGSPHAPRFDPRPAEFATEFLHAVGAPTADSNRVEVPFAQIAPPDAEIWTVDTTEELRVPIGRTGATKLQYLALGKGTRQHALIAGKTGSGKSTLLHVIITNLALWCRPDQVEFYLVDFKKGVEFKCYATHRFPHARVVAIESDREFGLSVLQRLDEELRRRGELFRNRRRAGPRRLQARRRRQPMPRVLLLIDEFQEFFVEEDAHLAAGLRPSRPHRPPGPRLRHPRHPRLPDPRRRLHPGPRHPRPDGRPHRPPVQRGRRLPHHGREQSRAAPALTSRRRHLQRRGRHDGRQQPVPGRLAPTIPCATDTSRSCGKWPTRSSRNATPGPLVFEGNAPADVRENLIARPARHAGDRQPAAPRRPTWLGAPNSIKGPTEAVFQKPQRQQPARRRPARRTRARHARPRADRPRRPAPARRRPVPRPRLQPHRIPRTRLPRTRHPDAAARGHPRARRGHGGGSPCLVEETPGRRPEGPHG